MRRSMKKLTYTEKLLLGKDIAVATLEEVRDHLKQRGTLHGKDIVLYDDQLDITITWLDRIQAAIDNSK